MTLMKQLFCSNFKIFFRASYKRHEFIDYFWSAVILEIIQLMLNTIYTRKSEVRHYNEVCDYSLSEGILKRIIWKNLMVGMTLVRPTIGLI